MPERDVYRRSNKGVRSEATYDTLVLCEKFHERYRHIDYLIVWNPDSEVMLASAWIITETTDFPVWQWTQVEKTQPHSVQVDFTLRPYDELEMRFYDGSDGDHIYCWAYGTVMPEPEGEAL